MRAMWMGALVAMTSACAMNPAPVPVAGAAEDLQALTGDWSGEYRSQETGRTGSILFRLDAGRDTAFGDVVMVPREAMTGHNEAMAPPPVRSHAQVLTIHFVRVAGNMVMGTIDPYPSPDCECKLLTTFRGRLAGDRIEGTFLVHHSGHEMPAQAGTWWVSRIRKAP